MKIIYLPIFLILLMASTPPQYLMCSRPVNINLATPIDLVVAQDLNFKNCFDNAQIKLKASRRVEVANFEVVKAEAEAFGKVKRINYFYGGRVLEVSIAVESVKAIDGTLLQLNPTEFVLRLEHRKGGVGVIGLPKPFVAFTGVKQTVNV